MGSIAQPTVKFGAFIVSSGFIKSMVQKIEASKFQGATVTFHDGTSTFYPCSADEYRVALLVLSKGLFRPVKYQSPEDLLTQVLRLPKE